jgi:ABC-type multidrug transport system ATPase subunit
VSAVNGLNLRIGEGEVYALPGHNGAGKTSTLRLFLRPLEPDSGTVIVHIQLALFRCKKEMFVFTGFASPLRSVYRDFHCRYCFLYAER